MRRIQLADCHSDLDCDREVINKDVSCIWSVLSTCNFLWSCVHFIFWSLDTTQQQVWILKQCKIADLHYMGWACTSTHNTRHILVCLFSRANKDHNKMPRTRSAGLQCCTDRTAAGIMISLQRIAAGIVQTQSVRQTKILIILLSRFEKNCGTNLKCIRDLSSELSIQPGQTSWVFYYLSIIFHLPLSHRKQFMVLIKLRELFLFPK